MAFGCVTFKVARITAMPPQTRNSSVGSCDGLSELGRSGSSSMEIGGVGWILGDPAYDLVFLRANDFRCTRSRRVKSSGSLATSSNRSCFLKLELNAQRNSHSWRRLCWGRVVLSIHSSKSPKYVWKVLIMYIFAHIYSIQHSMYTRFFEVYSVSVYYVQRTEHVAWNQSLMGMIDQIQTLRLN